MIWASGKRYGGLMVWSALLLAGVLSMTEMAEAKGSAESAATITWSDLKVTTSPGMSLNYSGKQWQSVSVTATVPGLVQSDARSTQDWSWITAQADAFTGTALAIGAAAVTLPVNNESGRLGGHSFAASNGGGRSVVDSSATHGIDFTVTGGGVLTLEVPYSLDIDMRVDNSQDLVSALAGAALLIINHDTRLNQNSWLDYSWSGFPNHFTDTRSGILSVSLGFGDGETGSYEMSTNAWDSATSVPEPSTFILLGSSLAGLILYKRRRDT
ncbi:MAG: PEP-CTERM sorting domain-containing protein [Terrimicrobiaceae bacterium]